MSRSRQPIFIVGCPRSGTSLLRNLLRSLPGLTFPSESHFIPALYRKFGDPASDAEARALAARILGLRWVRAWELPLEASDLADCRSYRELVTRIYDRWSALQHRPRWGDKTPQYVTEIPTLAEIFPDCQVLHIIRDGRDVARSWIHTSFGPKNVCVAISHWQRMVTAGRSAGARLPDGHYLEVRYETLLERPRETLQTVCRFLGEPFRECTLTPTEAPADYHPLVRGRSLEPRLCGKPVDATNHSRWRTHMSEHDRVLAESLAGTLLEALGYDTQPSRRTVSRPERMAWQCHNVLGYMMAQRLTRQLPARIGARLRLLRLTRRVPEGTSARKP